MKTFALLIICSIAISFNACAHKAEKQKLVTAKQTKKMDLTKITNSKVKEAFNAWQKGEKETFLSFFIAEAKLFDDGNSRDFKKFVNEACGHEHFTTIDMVENSGKDIYGNFHTESWGNFKTYFKFHQNADGKFDRLDIGQAN